MYRLLSLSGMLAAILLLAAPVLAQDESGAAVNQNSADVSALVQKIQQQYETLESFQAQFTQRLTNVSSGETQERGGTLYYMKPQLVRWETVTPENELLVVGRDAVWDYFADEEAAYKYDLAAVLESKTILRFISGQAKIEDEFFVEDAGEEGGLAKLSLLPLEPEPQLVQAYLWVDPDTGIFERILLMDFYGNENDLSFQDLELDPDLDASLFEFEPPDGVDVFDNTEPGDQGIEEHDLSSELTPADQAGRGTLTSSPTMGAARP